MYTKAPSGTINVGAAMYSDNAGAPNALLTSHTSAPSQGTTASWVNVPVTSYSATSGTNYWLWGWGSASRTIYWDSGATNQYNIQGMMWPTWDNPMTPGTYFARKTSIYATYTTGGGSGTSTKIFQDIGYTYDANGNITNITDHSDTGAGKTVSYSYDSLNRLTLASTTAASSTPYRHSVAYNSLGNITGFATTTSTTTYSYAGTNYANPHAATAIGSATHTYDNNGNLTSDGVWTHTWNYRNNLTQSGKGTATTISAYDHAGQRVKLTEGSTTTFFPNKLYETGSAKTTKHIFDTRGNLLATVETGSGGTSTTTTHTVYADSLNGWADWSWSTTLDPSNTSPVKTGTYSLKSTHTAAWGGMYLHHGGVNTSTSTHLSFSVRVPDAGAYIEIESYGPTDNLLANVQLNSYIPGGSMSANTWYDVNIPLADLNATSTTLRGIVAMRATTGTAYWDDMKLISAGSGGTGSTTVRYIHTDHLTGSNVVTDSAGALVETLDYYPYGATRIDTKVGNYAGERRKFAGSEYDNSSGLNYMQARYYSSARGQFISEDPSFLGLGASEITARLLADPQQQNSYSYARNNPLRYTDPTGEAISPADLAITLAAVAIDLYRLSNAISSGQGIKEASASLALSSSGLIPFVPAVGAINSIRRADAVGSVARAVQGSIKVGDSFGKLRTVVQNASQKVTGYTAHGLDQKISRGVSSSQLLEAAKKPLVTLQQDGDATLRLTKDVGVVLNQAGKVVTTYTKEQFLPHVKNVVDKVIDIYE